MELVRASKYLNIPLNELLSGDYTDWLRYAPHLELLEIEVKNWSRKQADRRRK